MVARLFANPRGPVGFQELKNTSFFQAFLVTRDYKMGRSRAEMKSHNWYRQQPAIDMISDGGSEAVRKLQEGDQITLGRNILQVADGGERSARRLLQALANSPKLWPEPFIRGLAFECFVNEADQVRLKCDRLPLVLTILDGLDETVRRGIVDMMEKAISEGVPKDISLFKPEFEKTCAVLEAHEWAATVKKAIESRTRDLVIEP